MHVSFRKLYEIATQKRPTFLLEMISNSLSSVVKYQFNWLTHSIAYTLVLLCNYEYLDTVTIIIIVLMVTKRRRREEGALHRVELLSDSRRRGK